MKKRHTETENYLKQALAKLLLEKNFEEVTVSDLTRTAGINRGTFYLHYVDKYDMADQFKNDTLDDLFHILSDESIYTDTRAVLFRTLTYVKENFEFIYAISKSAYVDFPKTIKDFVYEFLLTVPEFKETITAYYDIPYQYTLEVYLSSIESIISLWVANGGKESTEEITDIILKVAALEKMI